MYEKGLEAIRNHKTIASDPLEPSWGEPELLMNLAYSSLHRSEPDRTCGTTVVPVVANRALQSRGPAGHRDLLARATVSWTWPTGCAGPLRQSRGRSPSRVSAALSPSADPWRSGSAAYGPSPVPCRQYVPIQLAIPGSTSPVGWCPVQYGVKDDPGCSLGEGQPARGHLVEHCAKREQVRAGVQFFAAHLLRRHVRVSTAEPGTVSTSCVAAVGAVETSAPSAT
jgi:hypothetical protein